MCINKINEPFKLAYHILCNLCEPEPYLFLKSKNKHLLSFDVVVHTLAKQAKDP